MSKTKTKHWVRLGFEMYLQDPANSDYQRGYLAAMLQLAKEKGYSLWAAGSVEALAKLEAQTKTERHIR